MRLALIVGLGSKGCICFRISSKTEHELLIQLLLEKSVERVLYDKLPIVSWLWILSVPQPGGSHTKTNQEGFAILSHCY